MSDVVDPILAALQDKATDAGPPVLPVVLGRTSSVVVVDGPKVRFVLTADVAYHELDTDWTTIVGLYYSIREVLGDAVANAEDSLREDLRLLREERDQLASALAERDTTTT